jgi:LmbE family N-acetylglucosaminyl deacetylase
MIRVQPRGLQHLLCLGAHADDIEIGAGGTILRLVREYPGVTVHWVVFSASGKRENEARRSAECFLQNSGAHRVIIHQFADGYFPYHGQSIKQEFESLKGQLEPDLVITHWASDAHQDHRLINELTWNTFRRHTILEFEVPKYDGDLGRPNVYVPLSSDDRQRKVEYLLSAFPTQAGKHWFSEDTFLAIMRLRGVECGEAYAEAFYGRKLVL